VENELTKFLLERVFEKVLTVTIGDPRPVENDEIAENIIVDNELPDIFNVDVLNVLTKLLVEKILENVLAVTICEPRLVENDEIAEYITLDNELLPTFNVDVVNDCDRLVPMDVENVDISEYMNVEKGLVKFIALFEIVLLRLLIFVIRLDTVELM
jgi:hypothetical protein